MNIDFSSITTIKSGIICHGCNAQSVMGSGVAHQLRIAYPSIFEDYLKHLNNHPNPLGTVCLSIINDDLIIANMITQWNFGTDGKFVSYEAVRDGFSKVKDTAINLNMDVHFPLIGAGLGGGDWSIISTIIESVFADTEVKTTLHILDDWVGKPRHR